MSSVALRVYFSASFKLLKLVSKFPRFKNANQIPMPVGIEDVDDWRKFNYSLIKLFDDFSSNITKTSNGYLKNQTKDTRKLKMQLENVADILEKVR